MAVFSLTLQTENVPDICCLPNSGDGDVIAPHQLSGKEPSTLKEQEPPNPIKQRSHRFVREVVPCKTSVIAA